MEGQKANNKVILVGLVVLGIIVVVVIIKDGIKHDKPPTSLSQQNSPLIRYWKLHGVWPPEAKIVAGETGLVDFGVKEIVARSKDGAPTVADVYLVFPRGFMVDEKTRSGAKPKFQSPLSIYDPKLHPTQERHSLRISHLTSKGREEREIPLPEYIQIWVLGEKYTQLQSVLVRKILVLDEQGGLKAEFFPPAHRKHYLEIQNAGHPQQ